MVIAGVDCKRFGGDLIREARENRISTGAAALAYYLILSIFPALIVLLSLLPYLPIPNLEGAIMSMVRQALPGPSATLLAHVVHQVVSERRGGLLSLGLALMIWAASNGLYAVMEEINNVHDVKESRPFWKTRGIALLLTALFGLLIIGAFAGAFALVVLGGEIGAWASSGGALFLLIFRWGVAALAMELGLALTYYLGPDVEQRFKLITPGSVFGTVVLIGASIVFKIYVSHFSSFTATYGSLGAAIILLVWLYIAGWVILLGSEIDVLSARYWAQDKIDA